MHLDWHYAQYKEQEKQKDKVTRHRVVIPAPHTLYPTGMPSVICYIQFPVLACASPRLSVRSGTSLTRYAPMLASGSCVLHDHRHAQLNPMTS